MEITNLYDQFDVKYHLKNSIGVIGNSGVTTNGECKFSAYLDDNGLLCLRCENSPEFNICFFRNQFGTNISESLLNRINNSITGKTGCMGCGDFILVVMGILVRIDCVDDLKFWIEFSI